MLRALFVLGALVLIAATIISWGVMALTLWVGLDVGVYATLVIGFLTLVWIAVMFGVIARRIGRYFVKPS